MLTYEAPTCGPTGPSKMRSKGAMNVRIRRDKNATDIPDLKSTYSAVRAAEEWLGGYYILEYGM